MDKHKEIYKECHTTMGEHGKARHWQWFLRFLSSINKSQLKEIVFHEDGNVLVIIGSSHSEQLTGYILREFARC